MSTHMHLRCLSKQVPLSAIPGFAVCLTTILVHPSEQEQGELFKCHWIQRGGTQEQVGEADEEIDAVEAFKVCHTIRKKGMSDVAREVVVSPSTCLFSLPGFI